MRTCGGDGDGDGDSDGNDDVDGNSLCVLLWICAREEERIHGIRNRQVLIGAAGEQRQLLPA